MDLISTPLEGRIYKLHGFSVPHDAAFEMVRGSPMEDKVTEFLHPDTLPSRRVILFSFARDLFEGTYGETDLPYPVPKIRWESRFPPYLLYAAIIVSKSVLKTRQPEVRFDAYMITQSLTRMIMFYDPWPHDTVIHPFFNKGMTYDPVICLLMFTNEMSKAMKSDRGVTFDGFEVTRCRMLIRDCLKRGLRERYPKTQNLMLRRCVKLMAGDYLSVMSFKKKSQTPDCGDNFLQERLFRLVRGIGLWSRVGALASCASCKAGCSFSSISYKCVDTMYLGEDNPHFCCVCIVDAIVRTEISSYVASSSSLFDILYAKIFGFE